MEFICSFFIPKISRQFSSSSKEGGRESNLYRKCAVTNLKANPNPYMAESKEVLIVSNASKILIRKPTCNGFLCFRLRIKSKAASSFILRQPSFKKEKEKMSCFITIDIFLLCFLFSLLVSRTIRNRFADG